jgi:N-acetylneuraminic acid mutarotase
MRASLSSVATTLIVSLFVSGCASATRPTATPAPSGSPAPSTPAPLTPPPSISSSAPPTERAATWLDAGDLNEARNATHAVLVGADDILVVGSDYLTSWLSACGASTNGSDSVELGDPTSGVWKKTTALRSLRDEPAVVSLSDGRALLTGGAAGEDIGWSAYSSTYVFDPTSRQWSRSGLLNTARTETAATLLLDGRVLVAGGLYLDRSAPEQTRALDSGEVWDPRTGAWSRTRPMAETRIGASAVTLADGRVLVVGGSMNRERAPIELASAEIYDPASGSWNTGGALTTARSGFALVALNDGGALAAGGIGGLGTTRLEYLSSIERFDPVSSTWSAAADLPVPVAGASGIRLADGRVLVAGGAMREAELIDAEAGTYVSGLTADAELFDPEAGSWAATTPMPSPRAGASAVLLPDGSAVFVGGSGSEGSPADTPGCPEADPQVVRYVPGS